MNHRPDLLFSPILPLLKTPYSQIITLHNIGLTIAVGHPLRFDHRTLLTMTSRVIHITPPLGHDVYGETGPTIAREHDLEVATVLGRYVEADLEVLLP